MCRAGGPYCYRKWDESKKELARIRRRARYLKKMNNCSFSRAEKVVNDYTGSIAYQDLLDNRDAARKKVEEAKANRKENPGAEATRSLREANMELVEAEGNLRDTQSKFIEIINKVDYDTEKFEGDTVGNMGNPKSFEPGSDEWLNYRRGDGDIVAVGGSDIPAILRIGEYGNDNYYRVRDDKVGLLVDDNTSEFAQEKGDAWEPYLVSQFADNHPEYQVMTNKASWESADNPEEHANFDGLLSSKKDGVPDGILEIKTASHPEEWRDESGEPKVPDNYRAQVLWYLHTTGLDYAQVSVMIDDKEHHEFRIERGEKINDKLGTIEDNLGKIEKFRDDVRKRRSIENGDLPRPAKRTRKKDINADVASLIGCDKAEFDAAVEKRQAEGLSYREALRAEVKDRPVNYEGVVVLDLETTTRSPASGEIIELGYQKLAKDGSVAESGSYLFSPDKRFLKARGTGEQTVHNITPDDVRGKPQFIDPKVQKELTAKLDGCRVISHNARFESGFLFTDLPDANLTFIDSCNLSNTFFPETRDDTLSTFAQSNGVEYKDAHRALNDTDITRRAVVNMVKGIKK